MMHAMHPITGHAQSPCTGPRPITRAAGWSTMELMVAVALVSVGLLVMLQQISLSFRESDHNEHRAFAYQKAAAILQEIQNGIDHGQIATPQDLFALVDADHNIRLTTRTDRSGIPLQPDHPMSGNALRQGTWVWSRRIALEPHVQPGLYYVKVDVFRRGETSWVFQANQSQLLSLLPSADAPAQEFNVYVLAIGAAPSMWGELGALRTTISNAVRALQQDARARFRLHWITRSGYGRDPCYAPYVNETDTATAAAPWAYWLPGALGGSQAGGRLYRGELLGALHRTETGLAAGWSSDNPLPVTVADRNNHALRSQAARRLFDLRVAAGLERADEPPLQVLLDLMHEHPERYRGAIFVNLHGSALPMPPLRNYADAARDPVGRPGVRVVTHPARLQTPRDPNADGDHADSEDLELRVYAFRDDPAAGGAVLTEPITVQIFAPLDLSTAINAGTNPTLLVRRLQGGVNRDTGLASGGGQGYSGFDQSEGLPPTAPTKPYEAYYTAGFVAGSQPYTWIRLHNTPLVAPPVSDRGLPATARLYGLEYVPSPVANDGFTADLNSSEGNTSKPKNTARWRIRLPKRLLSPLLLGDRDHTLRIVTRIGTDTATGQRWPTPHQPLNQSETWAWWSRSVEAVPPSERAQFLGDPRHQPYLDLTNASGAGLPHGYNWHFDNLVDLLNNATGLWPCLTASRLQDGFAAAHRADVPRFHQLWRAALERCGAVWVNPVGIAGGHLLLGGEIAVPGSTIGTGVTPVQLHGGYQGLGTTIGLDTVTVPTLLSSNGEQALRASTGTWWAKPWLGELCPDAGFAGWQSDGNLPLGSHRWQAMHATGLSNLPVGTAFVPAGAQLGNAGALTLLNTGTTLQTFQHLTTTGGVALPTASANAIASSLNVVVSGKLAAERCFSLLAPVVTSPPAFGFTDTYPRTTATLLEQHFQVGAQAAVGAIAFGLGSSNRGFLVPMGLTPSGSQMDDVARQALMSGVRTLHLASLPGQIGRVRAAALPTFLEPSPGTVLNQPRTLTLRWNVEWLRYDRNGYTASHPPGFSEAENDLVYRILVSNDGGSSWLNALTRAPTATAVFPGTAAERVADLTAGAETLVLSTATAGYPQGEYLFRIEAFSLSRQCHHGWHQVRVLIRRSDA